MSPKELEATLRTLLNQPMADEVLRGRLEQLAVDEISFSGFTWLYGPELYRRNRIIFRPLILARFNTHMVLPKWNVDRIRWKGARAVNLEAWLAEVDRNDDAELFRRLYEWKRSEDTDWRNRDVRGRRIAADLLARFRGASTPAQRQVTLRKFDLWFQLTEDEACSLYECDARAAGRFILRRLPSNLFGDNKRKLWARLVALADARKDEEFRWQIYKRQIPLAEWVRDGLALCSTVSNADDLCRELERRHPESWGENLAGGFLQFLQRRGRDAFPYLMRHLRSVWSGWLFGRGDYGKMVDLARGKEWWDLWAALLRVCSPAKEFNKAVANLVANQSLPERDVVERLRALAGTSREWNWPGLGIVAIHQLEEDVALALYRRFPQLARGAYKLHIQANVWGVPYLKILEHFITCGDEEMVDHLASRMVTRVGSGGNVPKLLEGADRLATYYGALKKDETVFCRRAASVLGRVPAYAIWQYNQLIRENNLARLLFERSASSYLADPASLADLVEASEIHVMALAYRALGLDDPRAREQAVNHLPLLLGTLLRPMQRGTRTLAFGALANAAGSVESARLILDRARDALVLPDTRYPKEQLLGLIGRLLRRWPELRSAREVPIIYEYQGVA